MNPEPYTWRELDLMDHSLRCEEWDKTASIMAAVVNAQRTKNPIEPDRLNPYKKRRKAKKKRPEVSPLLRWL
jgi:hypothetical protein